MTTSNPETPPLPCPWRATPLIHSTILSKHAGCEIYLKLENLQPSGSFKSRGVGNFLLQHLLATPSSARSNVHFYMSSGGNAGLACVHAAATLGARATIVVPMSTTAYTIAKIRAAGAQEILQYGASWAEADAYLKEEVIPRAEEKGERPVYVPPFDGQLLWDGYVTIVEEVVEQLAGLPDAVVCSVGGGGLFSGIVQGLDQLGGESVKVVAVETDGADSLALSLREGRLSTLPAITSIATTLGARKVAARAFESAQREQVVSVVLKDEEAMEGCVRFAEDERIMVEASCGVSLALCYEGKLRKLLPNLTEKSKVVVVVCGGSNITAEMLHQWAKQLGMV